jgi:hypothetical protein
LVPPGSDAPAGPGTSEALTRCKKSPRGISDFRDAAHKPAYSPPHAVFRAGRSGVPGATPERHWPLLTLSIFYDYLVALCIDLI